MGNKDSFENSVKVSLFLIIAGAILTPYLGDFISFPDPIPVAQYDKEIFPENIHFNTNDDITTFSFKIYNAGEDGIISVEIESDKILSRLKDRDEFKSSSSQQWFVRSKNEQDFSFQLKKDEAYNDIENFTISVNYHSSKNLLGLLSINGKEDNLINRYEKVDRSVYTST